MGDRSRRMKTEGTHTNNEAHFSKLENKPAIEVKVHQCHSTPLIWKYYNLLQYNCFLLPIFQYCENSSTSYIYYFVNLYYLKKRYICGWNIFCAKINIKHSFTRFSHWHCLTVLNQQERHIVNQSEQPVKIYHLISYLIFCISCCYPVKNM